MQNSILPSLLLAGRIGLRFCRHSHLPFFSFSEWIVMTKHRIEDDKNQINVVVETYSISILFIYLIPWFARTQS